MSATVADDELPAPSTAVKTSWLTPACNAIAGTVHVGLPFGPDSVARPLPPRSLTQMTRLTCPLSDARPLTATVPVSEIADSPSIETLGGVVSVRPPRPRRAVIVPSPPADDPLSAPPQPASASAEIACAIASVERLMRSFIFKILDWSMLQFLRRRDPSNGAMGRAPANTFRSMRSFDRAASFARGVAFRAAMRWGGA